MACNDCAVNCRESYGSWYSKNRNSEIIPGGYVEPYNDLIDKDITGLEENDPLFLKYILKNCKETKKVCYFNVATDILGALGKLDYSDYYMFGYLIDYLYLYFGEPDSEDNAIKTAFFNKKIREIKKVSKYKKRVVDVRTGQQEIKEQLLYLYEECCICGIENPNLLIASHIKPLKDCSLEESYDINNGLLLCKIHDGLFDAGLISFDDNGQILISRKLKFKDRKIIGIDKIQKIDLIDGNINYIRWHRENVFKSK